MKVFSIEINHSWCKGCYICIDMCPKGVLTEAPEVSDKGFKPVVVERLQECNGCLQCEYLCPDMAITIVSSLCSLGSLSF